MKSVILYTPALHKGYINFFKENPYPIFLLENDLVREVPRLERDIRALDAEDVCKALQAIGFKTEVLRKKSLFSQIKQFEEIIMPDEDVSHRFVEDYLKEKNVKFVSIFLRWEKHNSEKKSQIIADEIIDSSQFGKRMMKEAIGQSLQSPDWWRQVGAVLVKDGEIILSGFNKPLPSNDVHNIFGDPRSNFDYGVSFDISKFIHAEAGIIAEAAKRGISLEKTHLYVTTFPCPTCAKLIAISGISEVYYKEGYSLLDAKDILRAFKVKIIRVDD
ncbi:MAG: deaminase [Minisyncoccales bacterium]|jgi:dCMP deaminase